jgi:hypothetical protein
MRIKIDRIVLENSGISQAQAGQLKGLIAQELQRQIRFQPGAENAMPERIPKLSLPALRIQPYATPGQIARQVALSVGQGLNGVLSQGCHRK